MFNYLLSNAKKLDIDLSKGIIDNRKGEIKGVHCDYIYYNTNGRVNYIEVKSTKLNKPNTYHFLMSYREYDFMIDNKDHYYILYVKNVYQCSLIEGSPIIKFVMC